MINLIREVFIGNKKLIKGNALVCVPISGKNKEELALFTKKLNIEDADLIEWRIDPLEGDFTALYPFIKERVYPLPLIVTYRTKKEGGFGNSGNEEYVKIIKEAINMGADAVDIELSSESSFDLIKYAKEKGVKTIASYHNFEYTDRNEEIYTKLNKMQESGADIYKMAFMPKSFSDTLRVLEISWKVNMENFPSLFISMGELGKISRIASNQSGAPFTFASAFKESAPGQMDAKLIKGLLNEIK